MIYMTETQAAELLRDLERESENLSTKAANAYERAMECHNQGLPAEQYFTQEGRLYDAQSAKVKDVRTKVSMFLYAHTFKRG